MTEIEINTQELLIPNQDNQEDESISSSEIKEVKQNEIKWEEIVLKIKLSDASSVLSQYEKDIIFPDGEPVIIFSIKLKAVYDYKWEVYHKPSEIKQNSEDIISELDKNNIYPKIDVRNKLTQISNWNNDQILNNLTIIENYYSTFFNVDEIKNTLSFKEFFNISTASFNQLNRGDKPFEGWGYKKADPHCLRKALRFLCYCIEYFAFDQNNLRWIVLTNDYIYYMKKSDSEKGKHLYFFDANTTVKINENNEKEVDVITNSRSLILTFKTVLEAKIWYYEIEKRLKEKEKLLKNNPYKAYTNMKSGNIAQWFSDGEKYFADLAKELMNARKSIFITDWWMSPEVWLVRPVPLDKLDKNSIEPSRLMDILFQCANKSKGVKIYIQLYAENKYVLSNDSKHTEVTLEALHPNIHVLRHPLNKLSFLWSHHEKLVIIDQNIAYVGGIDLCWGRFDTNDHPIFEPKKDGFDAQYLFPGIDYSNQRIRDITNVSNYLKESSKRGKETRLPWHDVHCKIIGPAVIDIARHFIERWNFTNSGKGEGITELKQSPSSTISPEKELGGEKEILINQASKEYKETSEPFIQDENEGKKEIIDEMENTFEFDKNENSEEEEINLRGHLIDDNDEDDEDDDIDFAEKKKMFLELEKKFTKSKTIIDKDSYYSDDLIEQGKLRGKKQNNLSDEENEINTDSNLITENNNQEKKPQFYSKLVNTASKSNFFAKLIGREVEEKEKLENTILDVNFFMPGKKSDVQVLRSASKWSVGIEETENSICQAYIKLIQEAKHYIYIENQFFVSKSFDKDDELNCQNKEYLSKLVINTIAYEIRKRIIKAYKENEKFRVMIFIPLLPGFPGEPKKSGTLQLILRYTYKAICRNEKTSIIEKLEEEMGEKWKEYIGFYSLRGHGLVNGIPKTEIIYIHSKIMIVDDKRVIIGSANINDRSMLGDRDSEFCVLIDEKEENSNFAHSFRTHLMAEHMGLDINKELDKKILNDPLNDNLWSMLNKTAKNNTEIYRKLFYCYPDDNMTTFREVLKMKIPEKLNGEELEKLKKLYDKEKDNIKGHVVEYPLHFLEREELGIPFFSKENLAPQKTYT